MRRPTLGLSMARKIPTSVPPARGASGHAASRAREGADEGPLVSSAEGFARQVAANLRRLRRERAWSLERLSALAQVSRAMLSQVETGKTTPTIGVLWKIATGFGVPFAELLREDTRTGVSVVRAGTTPQLTSPDRRFRSTPLLPAHLVPGVELYRITIEPQGQSRSPAHAQGTLEVVAVEKGRLRLVVGDSEDVLSPGDVASFHADVPHAYAALDETACVFYDLVRYGAEATLPSRKPPR
jgi:transcriptional regulator with XRE-family HTH domain